MRIGFFGQSGPFAPPALKILVRELTGHEVVLVVEGQRKLAGRSEHKLLKPDPKASGAADDLATFAIAHGIPALVTRDVNDVGAVRRIEEHALDLIVCVGFDRLFAPAVLATAKQGGVNAHPSRLPELRGPAPIFWAVKRGVRELFVTLHRIDRQADHGAVLDQAPFSIPRRATGDEIYRIAADLSGRLLLDLLRRVQNSLPVGMPQEGKGASCAPRPKPEDVEVLPGEWTADHLADFACGAPYFRTPFLRLGDDTFFVRRADGVELGRRLPAQYVLSGSTLVVQCKDGVVHLDIQV